MIIYIYSTQYEIGQVINDHLAELNNSCFLFETTEQLAVALHNLKIYPDLLILDYTMFNHDFFNIYVFLNEIKLDIPTIFYNTPCITMSTRAKHWLSQIQLLQNLKKIKDFSEYEKLFQILQNLIESAELSPYIKLMQEPLPIPDYLKKKTLTLENIKNNLNCNIDEFRERAKLPKNLFYLLSILQKNQALSLSIKDIQQIYQSDGKSISENSLKVSISNLRSEIRKDRKCKFIVSNYKGLYKFIKFMNS